MKKLQQLMVVLQLVFFISTVQASAYADLKGTVKDAVTNVPIPGAAIYISDLKSTTLTNAQGEFVFKNVPAKGKFLVEVRFVGYKTASQFVDFAVPNTLNFLLQESVIESAEVVITGTPFSANNKTNSLAVVSVNREQLSQAGGTNLVDALARVPGVSQISTGGAISKPVIRGLGYNRVLTIAEGAREETQQWGDEHGATVDQFSAARVEILKGPASLLYGSDALGGVINIIDDLVPAPGEFKGAFTTGYHTNNGLTASSLMFQGNDNGFVFRGRASYKNAFGFSYKDKTVPNSAFNETNFGGMVGLNKAWGYAHLSLSGFGTKTGLVEEGPDANGDYLDENGTVVSNKEARERSIGLPFQHINHYRAALNSNILLGGGQLKSTFAFQRNLRREFEEAADEAALFLALNSFTYDVKYSFPKTGNWEPTVGLQGMNQVNKIDGEEFLIPNYNSNSIGVFGYVKYNFGGGAVNAGLRYDNKSVNGEELAGTFQSFKNTFSNVSGSLGVAIELAENFVLKGNAGSGFRAPNIAELAANGKHEGTFRYEIGNAQLKQETSLQFDLGLEYNGEKISFGLNGYSNSIYNYIYPGNFGNETIPYTNEDGSIDILPVYRYVQTDARLIGGEAKIDLHPVKSLHFENSFSYVNAKNKATGAALPFIPAATLINELRFEPEIKGLADSYFKVGLTNVFRQDRFDAFETATDGYTLLDAGIGAAVKTQRGKIAFWVSGQNLANKRYFNHLSRYKLAGIFNPGRNISFGINVPF